MYRAFITRASSGKADNTPLIEKTLVLRQEQAELLGYPNYAEVSLASKVGLSGFCVFRVWCPLLMWKMGVSVFTTYGHGSCTVTVWASVISH